MSTPDAPNSSGAGGTAGPASARSGTTRDGREVPTLVRLAGFGLALAAVFGVSVLIGGQIGPMGEPAAAEHVSDHPDEAANERAEDGAADHGVHSSSSADGEFPAADLPGGLQISEDGYTLVPTRTVLAAGERTVAFRIVGPDGAAVTDYEIEHEKELHLIAVRRDFTGFQHVHPERSAVGIWSTRLDLTGGTWRMFADFTPGSAGGGAQPPLTLGTDLSVTGPSGRMARNGPATSRVDTVDGYRVEITGTLAAGEESDLSFAVSRDGKPVADLQPYLGARGHLVALREGDLAYLHVHPTDGEDAVGSEVGFAATAPSVGRYRLYLEFRVDGVVRTASFILSATAPTDPSTVGGPRDGAGTEDDGGDSGDSGESDGTGGHEEDDHPH